MRCAAGTAENRTRTLGAVLRRPDAEPDAVLPLRPSPPDLDSPALREVRFRGSGRPCRVVPSAFCPIGRTGGMQARVRAANGKRGARAGIYFRKGDALSRVRSCRNTSVDNRLLACVRNSFGSDRCSLRFGSDAWRRQDAETRKAERRPRIPMHRNIPSHPHSCRWVGRTRSASFPCPATICFRNGRLREDFPSPSGFRIVSDIFRRTGDLRWVR